MNLNSTNDDSFKKKSDELNQLKDTLFDALIIGGGPAGSAAALRIAELGGKACLVEKEKLGGVCAHLGCIPTKALLAQAAKFSAFQEEVKRGIFSHLQSNTSQNGSGLWGINPLSLGKLAQEAAQRAEEGVTFLLSKRKIPILFGTANILSPSEVQVKLNHGEEIVVRAKNLVLATGSRPRLFPGVCLSSRIITSDQFSHLFQAQDIPKNMIIIGAGYIGLEYACLLQALGTQVTLIESLPSLLPQEDREIGMFLEREFSRKGIAILLGRELCEIVEKENKIKVTVKKLRTQEQEFSTQEQESFETELLMLAMGREANTHIEGLKKMGISLYEKGIKTNEYMQTSSPTMYALGDVTGRYQLAHVASREGMVAAENIMGLPRKMDYTKIPKCIFTFPEIASVGKQTSRQGKAFFLGNGRGIASGETKGFVKIYREGNIIVGGTVVGSHASELINGILPLIGREISEAKEIIYPHPTFSETIGEALKNIPETTNKDS